jgi:prophage DNA circulation protein
MAILDELQAASFKGASFLIRSGSTTGGRKTVVHEYPNSDQRFVEDLGELKETFTIEGIVHGDNYFANRDALITALKSGGSGELVHPFFGTLTVVAQPYSLSEDTTTLGVARFSMTFSRSSESIFPRQSVNNVSTINLEKNNVMSSMQGDVGSLFNVSRNSTLNFTSAQQKLAGITSAFQLTSDTSLKVEDEISDFTSNLDSFFDNSNTNIFDPVNLALDLINVFTSFEVLGSTAKNQFDILEGLFDFGKNDEPVLETTVQRIERSTNQKTLNSAMQIGSLAQAYNVVTQLTFDTEDDINIVQQKLDDQFEDVVNTSNSSDNTIAALKELRVEVRKFLEQELVNVFRISQIFTQEISSTILTYQYYGSVDNTQKIINLNSSVDPTFFQGNVDILTT